ncbi:sphingosine-1-phosphate phosphatase 1 isoform X2 [Hemibagrus wyckioides]|uniref:sphingosine-1-phosphate phosphatase 1 isoform X2 n=1 Tax=Hemibagrus wyckioides TaxID=337641 RepID=UPI00266DA2A5|nr:sphingosine-1-phosphate phosphatase 1 isoform X2 [Hemibagrus wyckioides]
MGSALRTELTWLLSSLHDPRYVARFQELCGVRGTFTGNHAGARDSGEKTDADQRKTPSREGKGKHQDINGAVNGTANGAAGESARARPSGGSGKDGMARGPLRRNSLTGEVGHQFVISNRFLYYVFTLGTELGNELFYISFFPFLTWNVDPFVARRLIAIWVWVMYLGQCTKDLLRWPRPASPPVVKLEVFYDSEYSMPSTHAMSGTAVPLGLFLLTYGRWEDVIVGFLYSLLILVVFYPALDALDTFTLSSRYAPILVVSFHALLGLFSFTLDTWSTSRGDTAQILGTGAGIAVSSHLNYQLALIRDPPASMLPLQAPPLSLGLLGWSLLRFILGVLMLIVTRAVMKALTIPLVCRAVGIPSGDVRKARQNMQVELPYRYIVYWTIGFSAFFLVPFVFSCIGLY